MDSINTNALEFCNVDDIFILLEGLTEMEKEGSSWEDLMYSCLVASAYCAGEAEIDADEFMSIVRSIRVTPEGISGDC
jgi:hypothetical protein